jgi:hypothetical protein
MPIKAAASSIVAKPPATDSTSIPTKDDAMPNGSENGCGCLSVQRPIIGCRIEAVSWKVSVMIPICTKSSAIGSLING